MLNDKAQLEGGMDNLGFEIMPENIDKLLIYKDLLLKWNKSINLTSIKNKEIVTHHFLDCLAVIPFIKSSSLLDVGTGAGLPGIVIAIIKPDIKISLIDKVGKKIAFIKRVLAELDIKNVQTHHSRVELMTSEEKYDGIISRAFSNMGDFVQITKHLLKKQGVWYGMKSKKILNDEMKGIDNSWTLESLDVPFLKAERYLVKVTNS
ncbi:MAG: 16S rRNA (guanine(527)-N(7))-methyltransferase RsmG [Nitrosomonadales bacterium]|nr:16S rRNA (guanine(527)-N(7))-methyltransferase RsmG [Nitrosomonadales bacterium]MBT6232379.1 16S rRNA (guanine(527)-N(7))-methyltransferase RsmG [Nitrosomonadales bacterium]MBT6355884.1 16S rRNA (guanine(527)-N(7))-methyltransferase RsmG [Nitrosomonadales bacterium]